MKRKFGISLLLLAIYLFVMVAPAVVSLSCPCVAKTARGVACGCCCASHACGHHTQSDADEWVGNRCGCNHSHNTEVELYTLPSSEQSRTLLRCVVFDLLAAIGCEAPDTDFNLTLESRIRLRPQSGGERCCLQAVGLRAPPVCA